MEEDSKREIQSPLAMGTTTSVQLARRKQAGKPEQNSQSLQPKMFPLQQRMQIRRRVGNAHQMKTRSPTKALRLQ